MEPYPPISRPFFVRMENNGTIKFAVKGDEVKESLELYKKFLKERKKE